MAVKRFLSLIISSLRHDKMRMKIYDDSIHGCLSYAVGDQVSGAAVLIDPLNEIGSERYILDLQDMGLRLKWVIETHLHADHISCAHEISDLTGAPVVMGQSSPVSFHFEPSSKLQEIHLGQLDFRIIDTPGHTSESVSIILTDRSRSSDPLAVFCGDLLFAGDVGRSDLALTPEEERGMSANSFRSLQKLMGLPDSVLLYPAHYGASKCGGIFMSGSQFSTIGFERRNNRFLSFKNEEDFWKFQSRFRKLEPEGVRIIRERNITGSSK
jgi:glyoxylase-like metal-dependent hydrolase (beta-lactamase superfamily II)